MLGIKFIKVDPTIYLLQYKKGKLIREGSGLSFIYYAPTTSLVAVPAASTDIPFIFTEVTLDFQEVTIQGQVAFRVADPKQLSEMLNFTLDAIGQNYVSDDPEKFHQRIINRVQVLVRNEFQRLSLREVLRASDDLVHNVRAVLTQSEVLTSLGVEVLDLSILAIKPNPEMARALETGVREKLLEEADEAIYARRNSAVEQERAIKENELNTEIAVENKQRQIKEAKMDAERAVQEKRRLIKEEEMAAKISLEQKNKELVKLTVENAKVESDSKAYSLSVVMDAIAKIEPKVLNSLASMGMEPNQLIALAFRELAESAAKIGELNVSPDLLREISKQSRRQHETSNRQ
jgi:regulator of protease activity HflC (stomatin/prohibitin superfamily)